MTEFIFQAAQSDSDRQTNGGKNGHMDALHIASDTRHHTNNIKSVCVCINIYIYIQYSIYIILYRHHPALMKPGCHLALTNPIMICIYIYIYVYMQSAAASECGGQVLNFHERKEMTASDTGLLRRGHSTMWQEGQYRDCKGCSTANAKVYGIGKRRQCKRRQLGLLTITC